VSGTRHTRKSSRKHSCKRKHPYPTHGAAFAFMMERIRQGAAEWRINVYQCRFCRLFHVGHRMDPRGVHRH